MHDPYLQVLSIFNKKKVDYLLIGVSAINYYAKSTMNIIMTADYDIFVKPEKKNVAKALKVMSLLDYTMQTDNFTINKINDRTVGKIVDKRKTVICENVYHNLIEICLDVSGFTFEELCKNVKIFKAGRENIFVANLKDLLKMKEVADRPKDRLFLRKYSDLLE